MSDAVRPLASYILATPAPRARSDLVLAATRGGALAAGPGSHLTLVSPVAARENKGLAMEFRFLSNPPIIVGNTRRNELYYVLYILYYIMY